MPLIAPSFCKICVEGLSVANVPNPIPLHSLIDRIPNSWRQTMANRSAGAMIFNPLECRPDSYQGWYAQGNTLLDQRRFGDALISYERALEYLSLIHI